MNYRQFSVLIAVISLFTSFSLQAAPNATEKVVKEVDVILRDVLAGKEAPQDKKLWGQVYSKSNTMLLDAVKKALQGDSEEAIEDAMLDHYINLVKWSVIDFESHGGWPYRLDILQKEVWRKRLLRGFERRYKKDTSPIVAYSFICPMLYSPERYGQEEIEAATKIVKKNPALGKRLDQHLDTLWKPEVTRRL